MRAAARAEYRRLENQLYRVEIHRGGDRTQAQFKWSRDNGTVASAIVPDASGAVVRGSVIGVAEIGKDGMLTFASEPPPKWLELTDDRFDLQNQRGQLAQVRSVNPATRTITFEPGTLPALSATYHPVVRRWDQNDDTATDQGVPMTGGWQALESGVQVRFDDGLYRIGDFWLVPARTATGFESGQCRVAARQHRGGAAAASAGHPAPLRPLGAAMVAGRDVHAGHRRRLPPHLPAVN